MTKIRKYIENYWREKENLYNPSSQEYKNISSQKEDSLKIESIELLSSIFSNLLGDVELNKDIEPKHFLNNAITFIDRSNCYPYDAELLFSKLKYESIKIHPLEDSSKIKRKLKKKKSSFLFSLFPFGLMGKDECDFIIETLPYIDNFGLGIYIIPEVTYFSKKINLKEKLSSFKLDKNSKDNFFINAIYKLPEKFFYPRTGIKTVMIFVSKVEDITLYIKDFSLKDEIPKNLKDDINFIHPMAIKIIQDEWTESTLKYLKEIKDNFKDDAKKYKDFNKLSLHYANLSKKALSDGNLDKCLAIDLFLNKLILEGSNEDTLFYGLRISPDDFYGFENLKIRTKLRRLNSEFMSYDEISLKDFSQSIHLCSSGKKHTKRSNAFYIPLIGNKPCEKEIKELKMKDHNYAQIILKKNSDIKIDYIIAFLNNEVGRLFINQALSLNARSSAFIPKLNKSSLLELSIPIPPIDIQNNIIAIYKKLEDAKMKINNIQKNIILNPSSADDNKKINKISEVIGSLTKSDKIRMLASEEESKILEFKETFWMCVEKKTKEKHLMFSTLKTIGAFLNSNGGKLLIGVSDDHKIIGLNEEIDKFHKGSSDKFLNSFKDYIKGNLGSGKGKNKGAKYMDLMNYEIISVDGKKVLFLETMRSKDDVLIEEQGVEKLPVRLGPATDLLQGKQMLDYSKNRAN